MELTNTLKEINAIIEEANDGNNEIYEDMETYQDGYDSAAENMAKVQGVTDFAESFDDATRTMCYVEAGAQTLNAGSGALAAARLIAHVLSPVDVAMGIAAGAAAADSRR